MRNVKQPLGKPLTWLLISVLVLFLAACSSGGGEPQPDKKAESKDPLTISTGLPVGEPGVAGVEYDFEFTFDEGSLATNGISPLAAGDTVIFDWIFGDGSDYGQEITVVGTDGTATVKTTHIYEENGRYGVVFAVKNDKGTGLASGAFILEIGVMTIDEMVFPGCDGTRVDGGEGDNGVTIQSWDISTLPKGAGIDFYFDAREIPDRFIVEYPVGNVIFESGWRGSNGHDRVPWFPGGVEGPGKFSMNRLITVGEDVEFIITTIGPDPGTYWDYKFRCWAP